MEILYPYYSNENVQAKLDYNYIYKQIKISPVSSAQLDKEKLVGMYANAHLQCDDYFYTPQKFYWEYRELYEEMDFQRKNFVQKQLKIKSL